MIYIGRVSQEKNIEEIIRAMPEYMKTRPSVRFVIVGSGPALDKLQNMVKQLKLSDRFIFTGSQPWDSIGLFYQLGDVFVSASKSETQGLTYIEAMASGLPVVARQDKCLEEILEQGKNGYTFTNENELYFGLDQVLFEDKQTNYGDNAIEKVKMYSTQEFAYQVEKVYKQVVSRDGVSCKRVIYDTKRI
jgi:1,2-diacylglycerol 3-alpha-glucosyltransferase